MGMKISTAVKNIALILSKLYYFTNFLLSLSYDGDGHPTIPSHTNIVMTLTRSLRTMAVLDRDFTIFIPSSNMI